MDFAWDDEKGRLNLEKHGVPFEEAATVFGDPLFLVFADPDHSVLEARFLIVGESTEHRLLIVSYTDRESEIRLISAREATHMERKAYEEGL